MGRDHRQAEVRNFSSESSHPRQSRARDDDVDSVHARASEIVLDTAGDGPLDCPYSLRNLHFDFFDDSGLPRESRILMFYSFETDEHLQRSGILHYHVSEGRFVGPRHDVELTSAALDFLSHSGRIPEASPS
jgi:hypothetical protein